MKSLVSLQDLLAFELLAADLAGISMSACENTLQAPNSIPALFKAAQPTSRMDTLMGSQVFGCREAFSVGTVRFVLDLTASGDSQAAQSKAVTVCNRTAFGLAGSAPSCHSQNYYLSYCLVQRPLLGFCWTAEVL